MSFQEIVGHKKIVELLARSIAGASLPPSLIFAGPEGVGKRLAAVGVAQMFNCATADGCGSCAACRRIARGMHPDVLVIERGDSGSIKVEQIREAVERTAYRPFEGRKRVTIVDHAEALVQAAQNALLKTLEEPPSASVFILITSRPDALLDTIRSRCSLIRFGRLAAAEVATILEKHHQYSRRDATAAASASDGSVGRALAAQADDLSEARDAAAELLGQLRGRTDLRMRLERAKELVRIEGGSAAEREHLGMQLEILASMVRDIGVLSSGGDASLLANVDLKEDLQQLSAAFKSDRTAAMFAALQEAQLALERNVSPKVVSDWLMVNL